MKIVFATNNRHKLEEVSAILGANCPCGSHFELVTPADCGITEDIPETQPTIEGNALQKARYVYERTLDVCFCIAESASAVTAATGIPTFADDTGLEVAALNGAPGVRSARYAEDAGIAGTAGAHDFDENNRLLLRNLEDVSDRSARFRTVIALITGGEEHLFEGVVEGHIIDEYRGSGGFGYDSVFVPAGQNKTFAEMSSEQKNTISHRARAVGKLNDFLKNRI